MNANSFRFSEVSEPHRVRTLQILKRYPDVKKLMGKNPLTIFVIIGLVSGMMVISYLVNDRALRLLE